MSKIVYRKKQQFRGEILIIPVSSSPLSSENQALSREAEIYEFVAEATAEIERLLQPISSSVPQSSTVQQPSSCVSESKPTRKYIGTFRRGEQVLKAWWDFNDGNYYDENGKQILPRPRSVRYYAEGSGLQALNMAVHDQSTLFKGTEFMEIKEMSKEWVNDMDSWFLIPGIHPPNLKFSTGRKTGDVSYDAEQKDPTGTRRKIKRQYDEFQLTFPRGKEHIHDNEKAAAKEDTEIVMNFLKKASTRVVPGGLIKVVLMNSAFYVSYMGALIGSKFYEGLGLEYVNAEIVDSYKGRVPKDKKIRPYTHHITNSFKKPGEQQANGDLIYTFKKVPILESSYSASSSGSAKK